MTRWARGIQAASTFAGRRPLAHFEFFGLKRVEVNAVNAALRPLRNAPKVTWHSWLACLSKHFVEVLLKMRYFDKVFRRRMATKTLRHRLSDEP